jgi:hypothetical protein
MHRSLRALTALALLFVFQKTLRGSVVDYYFDGSITQGTSGPLFGSINASVGDPISGAFHYQTVTADTDPANPKSGIYQQLMLNGFSVALNGHVVASTQYRLQVIDDTNYANVGPSDALDIIADQTVTADGAPVASTIMVLEFFDHAGTIFADDSLPLSISLAGFPDGTRGEITDFGASNHFVFTLAHLYVPEPSSLAILGAGAVALLRRRQSHTRCRPGVQCRA